MKSRFAAYGLAFALVLVAVLLRLLLDRVVGDSFPFLALVAAVAVAVWAGGYRPALIVVVLGYAASNYLFLEPRGTFWISSTESVVGSIAYFVTCLIIIGFGETTRRARLRLAASEQRLHEVDRRKDEFLALLAHELRNPLAPIRNSLSLLNMIGSGDAAATKAREMMGRQLDQMVRLIDDLIDVSRMTRGTLDLRRERVELAPAVHNAVDSCRPMIDGAGQHLSVGLPAEPVYLDADPVRVAQILGNVLGNASKFTPHGGTIELRAHRNGSHVVIAIQDSGVGIPPDKLERVFEMFAQLQSPLAEHRGGLGVGLTLVKHLVELHGGTIQARSDGAGRGSEFVIRLPVMTDGAVPVRRATMPSL